METSKADILKMVQELAAEIVQQNKKIAELEHQVVLLEKRVSMLEVGHHENN